MFIITSGFNVYLPDLILSVLPERKEKMKYAISFEHPPRQKKALGIERKPTKLTTVY